MLVGKVFNQDNKAIQQKYLANEAEVCWRFLFQHRNATSVVISDEAGDTKMEMQSGKLVWPKDEELQKDIQARFAALEEAELVVNVG